MKSQVQPILLFGGTFDPIHYGHLRLAENLHNLLPTAEIRLMPSATPPHREQPGASAEQRLAMLQLATENLPHLKIDDRELRRDGESYTLLSVNELLKEYPEQPIILVMGDDAFGGLCHWFQWQSLLAKVNVLVVARPGAQFQLSNELVSSITQCDRLDSLLHTQAGHLYRFESPLLEISATHIRQLIAENQSCRFLLPESVIEYIQRHRLYAANSPASL